MALSSNHELASQSTSVFWKKEGQCVFIQRALGASLAFSLNLIPVQTRSSSWYDKHLRGVRSNYSRGSIAHNHLPALHSATFQIHIHTFFSAPPCFLFTFLSLSNPVTPTLLQFSEYYAVGFLFFFFACWRNNMVVSAKQWIRFTTTPFCLFVQGDEVCVVIWRCAISPQSHCHHPWPPVADSEQCFVSPHLFSISSLFISFLSWLKHSPCFHFFPCLGNNLSCLIVTETWPGVWFSSSYLQSCLHLPVGPSRVGKRCSGANYSNGVCAQLAGWWVFNGTETVTDVKDCFFGGVIEMVSMW